jgi:hypothetical protein
VHREEEAAIPGAQDEKLQIVTIAQDWGFGIERGMVDPRIVFQVLELGRIS